MTIIYLFIVIAFFCGIVADRIYNYHNIIKTSYFLNEAKKLYTELYELNEQIKKTRG